MEPSEALSTAAQIAVALAGFAGVVVAFRSRLLHEWTARDRIRLWLLLGNALLPFFSCLLGMLLLTIKPVPHFIWNWCSGFALVLTVPFAFLTQHRIKELGPEVITKMKAYRYFFYLVGALGASVALLQFYNALVSGVFWLFYAAVVFPLAVGALQFALMILLPSQTSES